MERLLFSVRKFHHGELPPDFGVPTPIGYTWDSRFHKEQLMPWRFSYHSVRSDPFALNFEHFGPPHFGRHHKNKKRRDYSFPQECGRQNPWNGVTLRVEPRNWTGNVTFSFHRATDETGDIISPVSPPAKSGRLIDAMGYQNHVVPRRDEHHSSSGGVRSN